MQTQATKLLARAQGLARTTAESPAGKAAWNVYERAAELVGVNVNEPVFGEDAERKTTSVLEEAAKQGYIVTDEAAQGKLWKQVYYTTLWQYVEGGPREGVQVYRMNKRERGRG